MNHISDLYDKKPYLCISLVNFLKYSGKYFLMCDVSFLKNINHKSFFQERTGNHSFEHDSLRLQYKLDNEFELVFVVAYQKILQLSYVDKFLNDVHLEFRDRFKNELEGASWFSNFEFEPEYRMVLERAEQWSRAHAKLPKQMRTFDESQKSKKTVASMIERKDDKDEKKPGMWRLPDITNFETMEKVHVNTPGIAELLPNRFLS